MKALLLAVLLLGRCNLAARAEEAVFRDVPATVVRVVDGDTIRVALTDGTIERVRYAGSVDAPEWCEPAGQQAREFNAGLVSARAVTLRVDGTNERDRFGRLLAYVFVGDLLVQQALLRDGYATNRYREIAHNPWQDEWDAWEREAWTAHRGLWGSAWLAYSPDVPPPVVGCSM